MSKHRFQIVVEVDDANLALHDGDQASPPNQIDEWEARDLFRAHDAGFVLADDSEVVGYEAVA